ncbi:MAG: ATP synthase F1 subunit gamma [Cyclobacteriaceae bacterium]|nr:ATP synthase F1 subunit gamma [Cyclobacteriaceae bacterium]
MPSLKEVRNRIKSVKSTQQITKAMKMVAASKLRKAQDSILQMRPFVQKLNDILDNVLQADEMEITSEFAEKRETKRILIVAVTSDRGLCGAFNSNIIKRVRTLVNERYRDLYDRDRLDILPIGKKAYDFFRKREYRIIDQFWNLYTDMTYGKVKEIAEFTKQSFKERQYDQVVIVYNEFKNVATQVLRTFQFLPIEVDEADVTKETVQNNMNYIFEPSREYIIRELMPQLLHIQFYQSILESIAAEHGARMTAMEQASENAEEILEELQIAYNRTRQAVITKELNEIVGGAQALSQD